jgi:hypothetical protein
MLDIKWTAASAIVLYFCEFETGGNEGVDEELTMW